MPRIITIEIVEENAFTVREGDRYHDQLCWDEALGAIAELTHPKLGAARYPLMTEAEHAARRARWAAAPAPANEPVTCAWCAANLEHEGHKPGCRELGAAPAGEPSAELRDVLLKALSTYRCCENLDQDGDGMLLADVLTHGGDIGPGKRELQALADHIYDSLPNIADAARYRWLRNGEWEPFTDRWLSAMDIYGQGPEELDAVIDAALSADSQTQVGSAPRNEAAAPAGANLSAALRAIVRECHGAATWGGGPLAIPGPDRPYSIDSYLPPHLLDLAVAALESTETPLQVIEAMRHDEELS